MSKPPPKKKLKAVTSEDQLPPPKNWEKKKSRILEKVFRVKSPNAVSAKEPKPRQMQHVGAMAESPQLQPYVPRDESFWTMPDERSWTGLNHIMETRRRKAVHTIDFKLRFFGDVGATDRDPRIKDFLCTKSPLEDPVLLEEGRLWTMLRAFMIQIYSKPPSFYA